MSRSARRALAALVVAFAAAAPILVLFLLRHLPSGRDQPDFFLPIAAETAARLRSGDLPLWNPRSFAGEPWLAAVQPGALAPSALVYAVLPFPDAHRVVLLLHRILLAVGLYRLARRAGAGRLTSAAACAAAALGPAVASVATYDNNFRTMAVAPWVLLAALRLRRGRPGGAVGLGLALAISFLGGEPQLAALSALLGAALVAGPGSAEPANRRLFGLGVAFALAPLLAGATLFPFLELWRESDRHSGLSAREALREAARPGELAAIAVGAPYGMAGVEAEGRLRQSYLPLPVLGAAGAALALAGLASVAGRRSAWPLLGAGTVLALASAFPALASGAAADALRLPFRYPVRLLIPPLLLGGPVLLALGLDRLLRGERKAILTAAALAAIPAAGFLADPAAARSASVGALLSLGAMALVASLKVRPWTVVLAAVVTIAEARGLASLVAAPHAAEAGLLSPPPLFELLSKRRPDSRVVPETPDGRTLRMALGADLPGDFATRTSLLGFGYSPLLGSASAVRGGGPLMLSRFESLFARVGSREGRRLLPLLGASGFVSIDLPDLDGIREVGNLGAARAFEWDGALPRAFLVFSWRSVADVDAAFGLLERSAGPGEVAALEPPAGTRLPEAPETSGARWKLVRVVEEEPERLLVRVEASHAALLVVLDSWYPGWTARVGGRRVPLLRADGAFRGVFVPPGSSHVEFRYEPRSFRLGLLAAAGGVLLAIASLALDARRWRRNR